MYASGDVEQPPEIVLTPPLVYPPDPRLIGLDGVVLVHAVVDAAGNVEPTTTQVLETPDSALGAAAVALVRRTLFRPARVRGRTVQAGLELAVAFAHAASPPVSVHFLGDVYRAGEVDEPPRVTSAPALVYPAPLLLAGIHGRVVVRAVLDTLGRVEDTSVAVVETADPRFNEPAKDYVRRSRFAPGRIAGRAVRVRVELPVEFRLPSRD